MPFVYKEVDTLQGTPLVGDGDCVTLIKEKTPGLQGVTTLAWRQGAAVLESKNLAHGTAIATFEDGKYPHGLPETMRRFSSLMPVRQSG
jgi:hypothetical protein